MPDDTDLTHQHQHQLRVVVLAVEDVLANHQMAAVVRSSRVNLPTPSGQADERTNPSSEGREAFTAGEPEERIDVRVIVTPIRSPINRSHGIFFRTALRQDCYCRIRPSRNC
jgi:hypothetical protein